MIVVFGSINVDLIFRVPTLPAPGQTVLGPSYAIAMGGKGANQAVAAVRDGNAVAFVGAVGTDAFGSVALTALQAEGIDTGSIAAQAGATGCAAICVDDQGQNQIAVASGANAALRAAALDDRLLRPTSTLVLQMEVSASENADLIRRARARGARIVLNLAPAATFSLSDIKAVDVLVVNEHEALAVAAALGLPAGSAAEPLSRKLGVLVVTTLGAQGAVAARAGQRWASAALPITPVDTTGAGDAFVGVFAGALDRGLGVEDALRRASVAGSLACTAAGAQPSLPRREAIERALAS